MLICSSFDSAGATRTLYTDEATFISAHLSSITDSYSAASGYTTGTHSAAVMNAFFGESEYASTQHSVPNWNIVRPDNFYCAGCNGSFEVSFLNTSLSTASGVSGVGIRYFNTSSSTPYVAYVTYGDGTTENFPLPVAAFSSRLYFGITSPESIEKIHFGLAGGLMTSSGSFGLENLTIGNTTPPLPPGVPTLSEWGLIFLFLGLLSAAAIYLRGRSRKTSVA